MVASEFSQIALLRRVFGGAPRGSIGVGDDAAVLPSTLDAVLTVDASVEGVHFTRAMISLEEASERAVEAAMSDAAAMGARVDLPGCGLLLAWTLPAGFSQEELEELARGAQRAAKRAGTLVVGGNLARATALTMSTTVLARSDAGVLTRAGAREGDAVAVTGTPGAAAIGLKALLKNALKIDGIEVFVERWRRPRARLTEGRRLAASGPGCALIDLSDGLCQDAGHIAEASGLRLVINADVLPRLPRQDQCALSLGEDPTDLGLSGGEDYELLATGPPERFGHEWTIIGRVERGEGVSVTLRGQEIKAPGGWDHFG